MYRSQMSAEENKLRSKLSQWMRTRELLRASLAVRQQRCGKAGCRCTKGEKHVLLVLERSEGGKHEQVYVPRDKEAQVRKWTEQYRDLRQLLDKLAGMYWDRVRRREF
jgi:hypothetical protein